MKNNAQKIDNFLKNFLNKQKNSLLLTPMKYGVISGGKKIRSKLIFDVGKIFNVEKKYLLSKEKVLFFMRQMEKNIWTLFKE